MLLRIVGQPLGQRAGAHPHAEGPPGLAGGNLRAQDAGPVFAREGLEVTSIV
jgi:hypothetical protein